MAGLRPASARGRVSYRFGVVAGGCAGIAVVFFRLFQGTLLMRYVRVLPFLAVLAVILYAGLKSEPVPQAFAQQDKLHHLLGFAALAFTLRLAAPHWRFVWVMALSLSAALAIELVQDFQAHRVASVADMVANTLGVLLGVVCSVIAERCWSVWRVSDEPKKEAVEPIV